MERNTRVTTNKTGNATVVGRLEDGRIILDADETDSQLLTVVKEAEVALMNTIEEVRTELKDEVLKTKAELQNITEYYWSRFIADMGALFKRKWAFFISARNEARAKVLSLKAEAQRRIREYNAGRRY